MDTRLDRGTVVPPIRSAAALAALLGVLATVALLAIAGPAQAATSPRNPREVAAARGYFTDTELIDQNGEVHRFYSDLLDGKVVVIDSVFTTCTLVCPVLGQKMKSIQAAAGDRLGKDVHLISISVDPETDTPAKLKAFGEQLEAREGWYFLTGSRENVERVLGKLGFAVDDKENHSTIVLMGNEQTGLWKKTNGLSSSGELVDLFRGVLEDTGPQAAPGQTGR